MPNASAPQPCFCNKATAPDKIAFTMSLGRNLKARKRDSSTTEPTMGNFIASCGRQGGWCGPGSSPGEQTGWQQAAAMHEYGSARFCCSRAGAISSSPTECSAHTFLVIASGGGSGLTDRQQPTNTWPGGCATPAGSGLSN